MKVLQVNKLYYPHTGGIENVVHDLAIGLKGKCDIEVFVANEKFRTERGILEGIDVTRVASLGRLQSTPLVPAFPIWLRKKCADIFHFHSPFPTGELAYLLARPQGKLVLTYHSDIIRQKYLLKVYGPFLRAFLKRCDVICTASPQIIESSPFLADVAEKCRVVPYGIDVGRFVKTESLKDKTKELQMRYGNDFVLFVGRLIYYKGIEYLVRAMTDVKANLVIVGTGPLENDMRSLARELGIPQRVHFAGKVSDNDLPAFYHACGLLCLPSIERSEAFGIVQLEAHACGKPTVCTSLPTGVQFANLDRVTGLVVPPRDVLALGAAISRILSDDALRLKYGIHARERVMREFTRERMAADYLRIYQEVLESK